MTSGQRNALLMRRLALYLIARSVGAVFSQLACEAVAFEQLGRKVWIASFDTHGITNRALPAVFPAWMLLVGITLWLLPARWIVVHRRPQNAQ